MENKSLENIFRILGGSIIGGYGFWIAAKLFYWALETESNFHAKLALIPGIIVFLSASIITIVAILPSKKISNKTPFKNNNFINSLKNLTANHLMTIASLLTILAITLYIIIVEIL